MIKENLITILRGVFMNMHLLHTEDKYTFFLYLKRRKKSKYFWRIIHIVNLKFRNTLSHLEKNKSKIKFLQYRPDQISSDQRRKKV